MCLQFLNERSSVFAGANPHEVSEYVNHYIGRHDIRLQFVVESVILSACGGLLGVLGAAGFSLALAAVLGNIMSAEFSAPVRAWAVGLALLVSSLVGLVAGLYPANRAALLDPVNALRSE